MIRILTTLISLSLTFFGCGEPEPASIRLAWTYEGGARIAEAIAGPEDRIVVMLSEQSQNSSGQLVTLDGNLGDTVEGPFDVPTLTEQAPVFLGANIFSVSKVGKIDKYNLAGQGLGSFPMTPVGNTGPIGLDGDRAIRVSSSTGILYSFNPETGEQQFQAQVDEAIDSPMAINNDGTTFLASPLGRLEAIDRTGQKILTAATTGALASGVTLANESIAVGHSSGVDVFSPNGTLRFTHPRSSAVIGTKALPNGHIAAWGQDGILDVLESSGNLVTRFRTGPDNELNPPTLSVSPAALDNEHLLLVDDLGKVSLIDAGGNTLASYSLDSPPRAKSRIHQSEKGTIVISTPSRVYGLRITLPSN
ncbi:MAG: hypothetical protein VYC39_20620 [Myxococcota bacterium]|nr:hypothetical protein [Myxococcota bacterium]